MTVIKNHVQLIGNLGKKPAIKTFESGKQLASFSMATSDYYIDNKGDKKKETQWHNIIVLGKLIQLCENYLDKGNEVAVNGKLTYRQYEDKQGNKRMITEIIANEILLLNKNETEV